MTPMDRRPPDSALPPDIDDRLSRLLDRWGDRHRLTAAQTESVRLTIVEAPPDLPAEVDLGYDWWRGVLSPLATALATAGGIPHTFLAGLRAAGPGASDAVAGTSNWFGWSLPPPDDAGLDPADYRPYVRLASRPLAS